MPQEGKPAGRVGWLAVLTGGLLIVAAVILASTFSGPKQAAGSGIVQDGTHPAAPSGHEQSAIPQVPQLETADTAAASQERSPEGCYGTNIPATLENSSRTRDQYAQETGATVNQILGFDVVHVYASGDDNKYLLYVAVPQDESALRNLSTGILSNPSIRAKICAEGFAGAQFIVKDENMHETLIANYKTDPIETTRYAQQRYATPVQ